ncbi:MAG: S8 family serine peptidase [Bacteroidota bacterium]
MKNFLALIFLFSSLLGFAQTGSQDSEFVQDEIIIRLKPGAVSQMDNLASRSVTNHLGLPTVDAVSDEVRALDVNYTLQQNFKNPKLARDFDLDRYFTVKIPAGADLNQIMQRYRSLEAVETVELNYIAQKHVVPNDPLYGEQWGLNNTGNAKQYNSTNLVGTPGSDINVEDAWNIHTGGSSVTIAIIDEGVDYNHPEFAGRMVPGYDFFSNDNDPFDEGGHGTACAGIAAAAGNNGIGVAGVTWGTLIMPLRALGPGGGSYGDIADAITFAVDNGANVISMSLGGGASASVLANAVNYAYANDVLVFASRGNGNNTADNYPSSYSTVISVGGLSPCNTRKTPSSCDGEFWWGASYGGGQNKMDFVAPAARITTTDITGSGGYASGAYTDSFNGTSSACPYAAGVGALIRSYNPTLTVDEIRTIMRNTSVDIGASGYDAETGFGKINAHAALLAAGATSCTLGAPSGLAASGVGNNSFTLSWNAVNGAASYTVTVGSTSTTVSGTSYAASGLTASTTYACSVVANCSGGGSGSAATINVTTTGSGGGCSTVTVDSENFESGWGIWNDGGSDARRSSRDAAYSNGRYSIRLRDNTSSSTMTTDNLNLSTFQEVTVDFSYYVRSFENVEDFWLQISTNGGSSYTTVETWARGTDFQNNNRYNESVTITQSFGANTRLRFRCDASGNSDWVYIDDVVITGCSTGGGANAVASTNEQPAETLQQLEEELEISVYPNPVQSTLMIKGITEGAVVRLLNMSGQVIDQGIEREEFDMSSLTKGIYLIQVASGDKVETFKVIKN